MDLWADDYELEPAPSRRRRDPRKVAIAALIAAIVLVGVVTVVVRDDGPPEHIAAAEDDERADSTTTSTGVPTTTTSTTKPLATTTTNRGLAKVSDPDEGSLEGTMSAYTIKAVSPDGHPLPGLWVYVGDTMPTDRRTDETGRATLDCVVGDAEGQVRPVVVSGVQINYMFGEHSQDQNWAPTAVEETLDGRIGDACGDDDPIVVTMRPGATLHVTFTDPTDRQREYYESSFIRVAVSIDGHALPIEGRGQCLPICYEVEGASGPPWTEVTIVGLPAGEVRAWVFPEDPCTAELVPVVLEAGKTTELTAVLGDANSDCSDNEPPPTG